MFWLKSCPRCHGDIYDNSDIYGRYIVCFQCGHYLTAAEDAILRSEVIPGKSDTLPPDRPTRVPAGVGA